VDAGQTTGHGRACRFPQRKQVSGINAATEFRLSVSEKAEIEAALKQELAT
jgi:hypothetical protein